MDGLIEGRIVHYVLSKDDAEAINRRRQENAVQESLKKGTWPIGAQSHVGNMVREGDHCPAMVVRCWGSTDDDYCNLKVLLDGNDDYWATSRHFSVEPKPQTWHWIEKA